MAQHIQTTDGAVHGDRLRSGSLIQLVGEELLPW